MAVTTIAPPPREPITKEEVSSNWELWFNLLAKKVSELIVASGSTGTVTSVTVAAPGEGLFSSGSPITVAGTINITLDDDVAAIEALTGLGHLSRTGVNTWALSTTINWSDITGTPTTLAGYGITDAVSVASLAALRAFSAAHG